MYNHAKTTLKFNSCNLSKTTSKIITIDKYLYSSKFTIIKSIKIQVEQRLQQLSLLFRIVLKSSFRRFLLKLCRLGDSLTVNISLVHMYGPKNRTECFP